jgi:N-acetylneuraminic acid mutarotase
MRIFWEDIGGQFNKLSYILLVLLLASCGSEEAATPISEQPEQPTALPTAEIISTNIPPTEPANEDVEIETTAATAENGEPADEPDFLSGSWTQGADMLSQRSEMPAVTIDGLIYVPGGFGGEALLEVYDPQTDTWARLADMPEGRHHLMAAAYNGRMYVFGGAQSPGWGETDTTWVYDPADDSWGELARNDTVM